MKNLFSFIVMIILVNALWGQIFLKPMVDSIPMRDGKKLAADIYLPDTVNQWPVILVMTPYNRLFYRLGLPLGIEKDLDSSKYAFVIVDWRCFAGSKKACTVPTNNGEDGYDVIDWISNQSWSNKKVGTWGPSALGRVQYLTLKEQHPNHICAVPIVAGSQYNYAEYFPGGVARTEYIEQLDALGFGLSNILYKNTVYNGFWSSTEAATLYPAKIKVPLLMIGGWYDHNVEVMMQLFDELKDKSPAANDIKMLFGPWTHSGIGEKDQGELSYPNAEGWSDSLSLMFYDYWLRGKQNDWDTRPDLTYYQMGDNQWLFDSKWPPDNILTDTLFLHENGILDTKIPESNSSSTTVPYNPKDPSPSIGGPTLRVDLDQGPYDQVPMVENRFDIILFSTGVLQKPIKVNGRIKVHLFVSSDRKDTDFAIRLTDVYPDGKSILLNDAIRRMRFRDGFTASDTANMVPGTMYEVEIEFPDLAHTFLPGHRLQIDISSSDYPRFDLNLNNGGSMYQSGDSLVAINKVYHDKGNRSYMAIEVTDPIILGISDMDSQDMFDLNVYPNPVNNELNFFISNNTGVLQIEVFDMAGKLYFSGQTDFIDGRFKIDMSRFERGMYMIKVHNNHTNWVGKVVKLGAK
jgi:uncharacterized protein